MDAFHYPIEIAESEVGPFVSVTALVATSTLYTWIPGSMLSALGVIPRTRHLFLEADGRVVEREIAFVVIRLDGQTFPTICVVGDNDSQPILGTLTLETFGFTADPVNRQLVRLPYYYLLRTG